MAWNIIRNSIPDFREDCFTDMCPGFDKTAEFVNKQWETIYQEIKNIRPSKDKLLEYAFLSPDKVHIERNSKQEVLLFAEDRWTENYGMCLVITQDGKVYVAEMPGYELCNYCAESVGKFMEIAEKYWEIVDNRNDSMEICEKQEKQLREAIEVIEPTALEREEYFWSMVAEEIGYGM